MYMKTNVVVVIIVVVKEKQTSYNGSNKENKPDLFSFT